MDLSALNKLYEQMNIHQRPGGGGRSYPYVKSADVFDRMNKTFDGNWSTRVFYQEIRENDYVIGVEVSVFSENLGKITQVGFGNALRRGAGDETGNLFKSALSKAIKDACKKWGVALYFDEDDVPDDYTAQSNTSNQVNGALPTAMPSSNSVSSAPNPMPNMNGAQPSRVPSSMPNTTGVPKSMPNMAPPPVDKSEPTSDLPKIPFAKENFIPPKTVNNDLNLPKNPSGGGSVSSVSQPAVAPSPPSGGENMISDIQMVALNTVLTMKMLPGETYESLVKDAFEFRGLDVPNPIPKKEDLTYQQAVAVIKYGNDEDVRKKNRS
jgi:hypothetical protein